MPPATRPPWMNSNQAMALDPKLQLAWADRAVARAWLRQPSALSDADRADTLGRPSLPAARARGLFAEESGDPVGAEAAYRRALALDADDAFTLQHLLDMEMAQEEGDAAGKTLEALARVSPGFAGRVHLYRATIDWDEHRGEAAKRELALAPRRQR